jgi:DNA-binding PadR family transcriptional regulator
MPRARDELSTGEWAVLALLSEGRSHGFALARAMAPEGEVGRVWSLRRPLVYRALETLTAMGHVCSVGTLPSRSGPQRTVLEATPTGQRALARWQQEPVARVRDGRSLLMLKLLFLTRRQADLGPFLTAQRAQFVRLVDGLSAAVEQATGFDRALLLWRLENTTAAIRFTETMLAERARRPAECSPRSGGWPDTSPVKPQSEETG